MIKCFPDILIKPQATIHLVEQQRQHIVPTLLGRMFNMFYNKIVMFYNKP